MVLIVISLGVMSALDGANATSGTDRARSIAAGVAQQDQEKMRSLSLVNLSNYRNTATQTVGGVPFTVASAADWVADSSGAPACTAGNTVADYLKITSTVTWPQMHKSRPTVITSLVSPPNGSFGPAQGSLVMQLRDRDANGVSGVAVSAAGPTTASQTTGSTGCVLFAYLPVGNYTVTLPGALCVDRAGTQPPSATATVASETMTSLTIDCDLPGTINASFDTKPSWSATPIASKGRYLAVSQSGLPSPGRRSFGDGSAQNAITANRLFPFTDGYNVYSGNCAGADPTTWGQTVQPPTAGQIVNRGVSYAPTIRQPALNLTITKAGVPLSAATVRVTPTTAGCAGPTIDLGPTNAAGHPPDPGVPYGTYNVCASESTANPKKSTIVSVSANSPNGSAATTIDIPTSAAAGTCP